MRNWLNRGWGEGKRSSEADPPDGWPTASSYTTPITWVSWCFYDNWPAIRSESFLCDQKPNARIKRRAKNKSA